MNGGKELDNIALQHVWILAGKLLTAVQGCMCALSYPTGIAIPAEASLKNGLDLLHQRMMHYPVPKQCRIDTPGLGGSDVKMPVRAWT
jgi:hypothetical protein